MSASSSDKGGFAVCWVMAVRGVASHKPSFSNGKGRWPLTLAQRVFLVLVTKLITTGFVGCAFNTQELKSLIPNREALHVVSRLLQFIDHGDGIVLHRDVAGASGGVDDEVILAEAELTRALTLLIESTGR